MRSNLSGAVHTRVFHTLHSFNKTRTWRARILSTMACLCAGLMAVSAQAAFQVLEDFDSLTLTNISGQNGWFASQDGAVVLDPAGGSNQVLRVMTDSGVLHKAAGVAKGTSRMLFLRFRFEEHGEFSFGLSHMSLPNQFSEFGPELGMAAATTSDPNNDFRVANGLLPTGIYDVLETLTPGDWFNVWVYVNHSSDTYEVWLNADPGGKAQADDQLDNSAAETLFGFRTPTAADLINFFIKTGGGNSPPDGRFYLDDIYLEDTAAVNLNNPLGDNLVAAVLPASRSVQVGNPAAAFGTIINTGSATATDCGIAPLTSVQADFTFQTTDASNALIGTPDTPVDIAAGGSQSYVFTFTPTAPFGPVDMQLAFDCGNTNPAAVTLGLNTLRLVAASEPVPDIVALAATLGNDGIVNLASIGVFAVATVNIGITDTIAVRANTGSASLPVSVALCETDPATSVCINPTVPIVGSVTTTIAADATPTFAFFVTGTDTVPFVPETNRIFVHFEDADGVTRGATSVAVRTLE